MTKLVGVYFKTAQRICFCFNEKTNLKVKDFVICKTENGLDLGEIYYFKKEDEAELKEQNLNIFGTILRKATKSDLKKTQENLKFENQAFKIGEDLIKQLNLNMKLILVVSSYDRLKFVFFFTAKERVDFRELVKKLAFSVHARVELRQIGSRDETKILCGIGICGRPFCCSSFLKEFHHVSIKMAKDQNLSLNPKKISGCCGKLMCCLKYEQECYCFLNKICPKVGDLVMTPDGEGVVLASNPLTGNCKVRLTLAEENVERNFKTQSLKHIKKENLKNKKNKDF